MRLTLLLVALNAIAFLYSLTNFDYILNNYGFNSRNFLSGNYHIIITSMFLHANLGHLLSNMFALFFLGWTVEKNVNKWLYLLVYFLSGITGDLLTLLPIFGFTQETVAVGASAAISGLIGLGTFICPGKFVIFTSIPMPFVVAGALYLLVNLSNLFIPSSIAYSSHLAGMATGAIFGLVLGESRKKRLLIFALVAVLILIAPKAIPLILDYLKAIF